MSSPDRPGPFDDDALAAAALAHARGIVLDDDLAHAAAAWLAARPEHRREVVLIDEAVSRAFPKGKDDPAHVHERTGAVLRHIALSSGSERAEAVTPPSRPVPYNRLATGTAGTARAARWGKPLPRPTAWHASAALVVLAFAALGIVMQSSLVGTNSRRVPPMTSYVTEKGQHARIRLADGATVYLGVDSRLDVPTDYATGSRSLTLVGEASFTVPHHSSIPFTVTTRSATVRVLGTHFVTRQYATDSTTLVAVRDGKVLARSLVLSAAEEAEIDRRGIVQVRKVDPSAFGLETGRVVLNSVPLPAAIIELNRQYDVDIRLADASLAAHRFTGDLGPMSPADLADLLHLMFGVKVVRDDRVLTLYAR